jgi:anti-sigma regulatory factor (Ser/Thr protein kinase)
MHRIGTGEIFTSLTQEPYACIMPNAQHRHQLVQFAAQAQFKVAALRGGHSVHFVFQTPQEAEVLAATLAELFPNPINVELGLKELMQNAIEHGNLEIGFAQKSALLASGKLHSEVEQRLRIPRYNTRSATLSVTPTKDYIDVTISDRGAGFEWQPFLCMDEHRLALPHGRGIALANMVCFDRLSYNDVGNQVTARCVT